MGETGGHAHWLVTVVTVEEQWAELVADAWQRHGAGALETREIGPDASGSTLVEIVSGCPADGEIREEIRRLTGEAARVRTELIDREVADRWKSHARPVRVGDLRIVPAWHDDATAPRGSETTVVIDPADQFGLGDHPTTRGMLEQLQRVLREMPHPARPVRIVDAGCGSGVLGICAVMASRALQHPDPLVAGFDVAPGSAAAVEDNCRCNSVTTFRMTEPDGIDDAWSDVTMANIQAPVLCDIASDLRRVTADHGVLLLGGMRAEQRDRVAASYPGWRLIGEAETDGWWTLRLAAGR